MVDEEDEEVEEVEVIVVDEEDEEAEEVEVIVVDDEDDVDADQMEQVPVVDNEQTLLRKEGQYMDNIDNIRRLQEQLQRLQSEQVQIRHEYLELLPAAQATIFATAEDNNNVYEYLSDVTRERRQRNIPRTYRDWNYNTRGI